MIWTGAEAVGARVPVVAEGIGHFDEGSVEYLRLGSPRSNS